MLGKLANWLPLLRDFFKRGRSNLNKSANTSNRQDMNRQQTVQQISRDTNNSTNSSKSDIYQETQTAARDTNRIKRHKQETQTAARVTDINSTNSSKSDISRDTNSKRVFVVLWCKGIPSLGSKLQRHLAITRAKEGQGEGKAKPLQERRVCWHLWLFCQQAKQKSVCVQEQTRCRHLAASNTNWYNKIPNSLIKCYE